MSTKTNGKDNHPATEIESLALPAIASAPEILPEVALSGALLRFSFGVKTQTGNPDELAETLDALKAIFRVPPALRHLVVSALNEVVPLVEKVGDENARLMNNAARQSVGVKTETVKKPQGKA